MTFLTLKEIRAVDTNPESQKPKTDSLVDTINISAATHYYPSSTGFSMFGYKDFSITGKLIDADGTLTLTVEATNDEDLSSGDWIDITNGGYRPDNDTTGNASITVTNGTETFAMDFDECNYATIRIKVVANGATNTAICKLRRKTL